MILFILTNRTASAQEQMILDSIGMDELIVYADEAGFDLRDWLSAILSGSAFPNTALSDLFDKIKEIIIADGVRILALSFAASGILSMLRMTVQNSESRITTALLCRIFIISELCILFIRARSAATDLIESSIACTNVISPVMIAASAMAGTEASAATVSSLTGICSSTVELALGSWGIAIASACVCIAVSGNLCRSLTLNRMHSLFARLIRWACGGLLASFLALMNLQGRIGSARDSAAVRTTRYAIENLIPGVGGNVSDSLDTLLSTARLVRNAVGTSGLLLIVHICVVPFIKIAISALICRLAAAICEPLEGNVLPPLLEQFAEAMNLLLILSVTAVVICGLLIGGYMNAA